MAKATASILIHKPIKVVFEYIASLPNGPIVIPNLNEISNIHPDQPGVGQTFDWRFNLAGIDLIGTGETTEYIPPQAIKIVAKGEINSTWNYAFQQENNGTKFSLEIEYEIAENIIQKLANKLVVEQLNQRSAEQFVQNLKLVLES